MQGKKPQRTQTRNPRPWFRKTRGWYVTEPDGRQVFLAGADASRDDAERVLIERLSAGIAEKLGGTVSPNPPEESFPHMPRNEHIPRHNSGINVADAVAAYLATGQARILAGKLTIDTWKVYRTILTHLVSSHGHRALCSLTALELEGWANREEWSPSYQRSVLKTILQLLRASGIVLKVDAPQAESRGAEAIITDEQFRLVLADLKSRPRRGDLAELLEVLRECGARPSEISRLKVDAIDWGNACTRLREHKTRRHGGGDRVIHFTREAMRVLEGQRAKYKDSGLLFRTLAGNGFSKAGISSRMGELSDRLGFRITAYFCRHTFATRALEAGVSDVLVAGLLGHKGTGMLMKHYSHITANAKLMKEAVEQATGGKPA